MKNHGFLVSEDMIMWAFRGVLQSPSDEIWRTIKGFPDYEVSSFGRIKSTRRWVKNKAANCDEKGYFINEKILKQGMNKNGYFSVFLRKTGKTYTRYTHKLVALAFLLNPENKSQINHINGDKEYNDRINLEWVTPSENMKHAVKHGLFSMDDKKKAVIQKELACVYTLYKFFQFFSKRH